MCIKFVREREREKSEVLLANALEARRGCDTEKERERENARSDILAQYHSILSRAIIESHSGRCKSVV